MRINYFRKFYQFFSICFNSKTTKKLLELKMTGMADSQEISHNRTYKICLIPLPPLAEQNAIVERVDRLLASVNALEQQVKERKTFAEQLMQAVLKEAFAG